MTNSDQAVRKASTSIEETITPDTEAKFVSNKGTEFQIETAVNGLFFIKMKAGGAAPSFVHEFYTSKQEAQKVLERYLRLNDRTGNAKFPSKGK